MRVSDRGDTLEALQRRFKRRALGSALGQLVLDDGVLAAGVANSLAQLKILVDGELHKSGKHHIVNTLQIRAELLDLLCLFCFGNGHFRFLFAANRFKFSRRPCGRALNVRRSAYSLTLAANSTAVVSSAIPGPMLEERYAPLMYLPFAADGLAFTTLEMIVVAFSTSLLAGNEILPTGTCTRAVLSVRNSTFPALISLIALATSNVTVPVFGFGMRPFGPKIFPSLPTDFITSGVAMR